MPSSGAGVTPRSCLPFTHACHKLGCREKKGEARQVLAASVAAYPCNWSAWLVRPGSCWGVLVCMGVVARAALARCCLAWLLAAAWLRWLQRPKCQLLLQALSNTQYKNTSRCPAASPCALQALQSVCGDLGAAAQLALPDHFMRRFFRASLCVESHHNAEALQHLQVAGEGL